MCFSSVLARTTTRNHGQVAFPCRIEATKYVHTDKNIYNENIITLSPLSAAPQNFLWEQCYTVLSGIILNYIHTSIETGNSPNQRSGTEPQARGKGDAR